MAARAKSLKRINGLTIDLGKNSSSVNDKPPECNLNACFWGFITSTAGNVLFFTKKINDFAALTPMEYRNDGM
jgi:hypothetical protein